MLATFSDHNTKKPWEIGNRVVYLQVNKVTTTKQNEWDIIKNDKNFLGWLFKKTHRVQSKLFSEINT